MYFNYRVKIDPDNGTVIFIGVAPDASVNQVEVSHMILSTLYISISVYQGRYGAYRELLWFKTW